MNRISKLVTPAALLLGALHLGASEVHALTTLRDIKVKPEDRIELTFDQKVRPGQIEIDYFRDIIQFSIKNVSVYPAKIVSADSDAIKKVFAYQYTPKLIRCRLTVEGKAEDYRGKIRLVSGDRHVRIEVQAPNQKPDKIVTQAAQAVRPSEPEKPAKKEAELLNNILGRSEKAAENPKNRSTPDPFKTFRWLAVLLAAFGIGALMIRKVFLRARPVGTGGGQGKKSLLNRIAASAGIGTSMIEVISSKSIGPKKSITVVRVKDRILVLGVANESINLITEFQEGESDPEEDLSIHGSRGTGATSAGPALFSQMLDQQEKPSPRDRVREQIRKRIEGMKDL